MAKDQQKPEPKKVQKKEPKREIKASRPISKKNLIDLLNFLNRKDRPRCNNTFKETIKFLRQRKLDVDEIIPWLQDEGGYCDCEVAINVLID
jgi:hypothetical protein